MILSDLLFVGEGGFVLNEVDTFGIFMVFLGIHLKCDMLC